MSLHGDLATVIDYAFTELLKLDENYVSDKPEKDKWSKKEILGHLNDSFLNNAGRVILAYDQNHLNFDGYNADLWVTANGYQAKTWLSIVNLWKVGQQQMVDLIRHVPAKIMNNQTKEHRFNEMLMVKPQKGEVSSLGYLIADYIYHQEYHLKQIIKSYVFQSFSEERGT